MQYKAIHKVQGTLGPIPSVGKYRLCLSQYLLCAFLSFSHLLMHVGQCRVGEADVSLPELTRRLPQGMGRTGSPVLLGTELRLQGAHRWGVTPVLHSVTPHMPSSSMLWCLQVLTPTPLHTAAQNLSREGLLTRLVTHLLFQSATM